MGYFSWDCKKCGRSLLASTAPLNDRIGWQAVGVAVLSDGKVAKGLFNGYGRLDGPEGLDLNSVRFDIGEPDIFHKACWEAAGMPDAYTGGSPFSRDQGFFINPAEREVDPPEG